MSDIKCGYLSLLNSNLSSTHRGSLIPSAKLNSCW